MTERHSADTRDKLIDATIQAVFADGYVGATMSRIAKRAGVTRGAIQHHFGDRRVDMMAQVTQHILRERQEAYALLYTAPAGEQPIDSRAAMKAAYRDPATWFLIEIWIASKSDSELRDRVNHALREVNDRGDDDIQIRLTVMSDEQFRIVKSFVRSLTRGISIEYSRKQDHILFDKVVDFAMDAVARYIR